MSLAILLACVAVDGDTLRCSGERIRLLAIDAPELHGCPAGRACVAGDGEASKRALASAISGQRVAIERVGKDRFGRTLGVVYAGGQNLSCAMVASGAAIYVERWDDGGRVARDCG
jgi:micrococcal nuclease